MIGLPRGAVLSTRLDLLRRLTINDERALSQVLSGRPHPQLDARTRALVRIAGLVASDAAEPSYQSAVDAAHASGVEDDEILEMVLSLVPIVGFARMSAAAPLLLRALGYQTDDLDMVGR